MKIIQVAGDNLFHLAAVHLADATQWIRIAQINRISDPMLRGVTTLLIPDVERDSGGGIAPQ